MSPKRRNMFKSPRRKLTSTLKNVAGTTTTTKWYKLAKDNQKSYFYQISEALDQVSSKCSRTKKVGLIEFLWDQDMKVDV